MQSCEFVTHHGLGLVTWSKSVQVIPIAPACTWPLNRDLLPSGCCGNKKQSHHFHRQSYNMVRPELNLKCQHYIRSVVDVFLYVPSQNPGQKKKSTLKYLYAAPRGSQLIVSPYRLGGVTKLVTFLIHCYYYVYVNL